MSTLTFFVSPAIIGITVLSRSSKLNPEKEFGL